MVRLSVIGALFIFLCLPLSLKAQDTGEPDTVRIVSAATANMAPVAVPVTLYNDAELSSVVIPLFVYGYSGWLQYDSVSYTGGRLDAPSILDDRIAYVFATDTFTFDSMVISLGVSSGSNLQAGDGEICQIWFTPLFGGEVSIDSLAFSPYGALQLTDASANTYIPQFIAGIVDIACDYVIGDVNEDTGINVGDVLPFFKSFFGCMISLPPRWIADVNCDRRVDARDYQALVAHAFYGGEICQCGTYSPPLYNDPGNRDTLRIENKTLYVGIEDTIDVTIIFDETIAQWSFGLEWDGSSVLNLSNNFNYGGGYLCADRLGNPGYVGPYSISNFSYYPPGDSVIARLPFTALNEGEAAITVVDMWNDNESMIVTDAVEAVIPVVVGGNITVLPRQCGDANGDGGVNLGDVVFIVNYVFRDGPAPDPLCYGDANNDGSVNIGEATYLIGTIFKGGPFPPQNCCEFIAE